VGSKPGSSRFHLFSHFHHFTANTLKGLNFAYLNGSKEGWTREVHLICVWPFRVFLNLARFLSVVFAAFVWVHAQITPQSMQMYCTWTARVFRMSLSLPKYVHLLFFILSLKSFFLFWQKNAIGQEMLRK
jgi:hypothetical protein